MRWIPIALLLLTPLPLAHAQNVPPPSVDITAGWVGFADDSVVSEGLVGGAVRWYVSPRLAVGPEVSYITGNNHSHLIVTGNLTWDVVSANRRVTPFLVAGGGMFQTRHRFPRDNFTSREGAFTAGGGVRTRVADRVTVGVDARVGWELHLRVAGLVGVRLGR